LVEAELLYQKELTTKATYTFKHALIQDAAYESLLKEYATAVSPTYCLVLRRSFQRRLKDNLNCWHITIGSRSH